MNPRRSTILLLSAFYLPGFRSGGPLRSILNIIDSLYDDFEFLVLTSDRDLGDRLPYEGITHGVWREVGNAKVRYLAPRETGFRSVCRIIARTDHDLLYLNSFFAPWPTIFPLLGRRLGLIGGQPILLAPRGEFSMGALALKASKKKCYLFVAKHLQLLRGLKWHASSGFEAQDIRRTIGNGAQVVFIASDLPDVAPASLPDGLHDPSPVFSIAFLSRISPKKNLHYAIDVLMSVRYPVQFNIYGPAEDADYWACCTRKLKALPEHVSAEYHGIVTPDAVPGVMRSNDLLFLPTLGENFGHVIAEALSMGTEVLISDQTPWRGLVELKLGNDINLEHQERFVEVIESRARSSVEERYRHRLATHFAYVQYRRQRDDVQRNREMFFTLMDRNPG